MNTAAIYICLSREDRGSGENGTKHPLSGKVFCGECGSKMYKCKSGGIPYFRCHAASSTGECDNHKRIRLDALVVEKINDTLEKYVNGKYLMENVVISDRLQSQLNECINRKQAVEAELAKSREMLKRLLEKYMSGEIENSIYEEVQNDYLKNRDEYEYQIAAINMEIEEINKSMLNREDKESIVKKYKKISSLTIAIVQAFIDSIVIGAVADTPYRPCQ